jgi:hypothetical protein
LNAMIAKFMNAVKESDVASPTKSNVVATNPSHAAALPEDNLGGSDQSVPKSGSPAEDSEMILDRGLTSADEVARPSSITTCVTEEVTITNQNSPIIEAGNMADGFLDLHSGGGSEADA